MKRRSKNYLAGISNALAVIILCLLGSAIAQNPVVYTKQANPPAPGVPAGKNSYDSGLTWSSAVCSPENPPEALPKGSELEWASVLDPGQDAEKHLVAVSGIMVYDPDPGESGFCQGAICPGQPISCSTDSDCGSCGGSCDLGQGPSCSGGTCPSPFTGPQTADAQGAFPIACTTDAQCGACGGTCSAKGRSRNDLPMTHPFGFDFDASIAPDSDYYQLLSPGNVESTHVDHSEESGQTALTVFGGQVYPFLHATSGITLGWCAPDFSQRCKANSDCGSGMCEGLVPGFSFNKDTLPGVLGVETDHDILPETYQPQDGDRAAIFGRWIVDCGHGDDDGVPGWHTEIHPPLLIASGRTTGSGFFGANCSNEQTCSSVIGRPFLVSQDFGDGKVAKHVENEAEKLGCTLATGPAVSTAIEIFGPLEGLPDCDAGLDAHCVCNGDFGCELCEAFSCGSIEDDLPFGSPCTTQLEERPRINVDNGAPFSGTQDMQYFVEPAAARQNPGDRMVAKWHFTARNGVTVGLSNAGDAGVLVDVTMNENDYHSPSFPSKQDWVVDPGEVDPDFSFLGIAKTILAFSVAPVQAAIVDQGLFTDRFQAPQVPANDASPTLSFADQLNAGTQAAQDLDDNQVFPVSGRINVGWFRCNPGAPYVAECTGPTTAVTLNGLGSRDPDGNPLTFSWSGGFLEGTATGGTPVVTFPGTGTFPVDLAAADSELSTTCSTTATVRDTTPPTITIVQPTATTYTHSSTLTLNYSVTDICTGVTSFTPTMDNATSVAGHGLQSGQPINLLLELGLGQHTFAIGAVDAAGNADTASVVFTIIVTPDSIKDDVTQFFALGEIKNQGIENALLAKLNAAANARLKGDCNSSSNNYSAFINQLTAQSGKGVDANAAAIMIADAQYLITHCP